MTEFELLPSEEEPVKAFLQTLSDAGGKLIVPNEQFDTVFSGPAPRLAQCHDLAEWDTATIGAKSGYILTGRGRAYLRGEPYRNGWTVLFDRVSKVLRRKR